MWRVYKESGRPWPTLDDDDLIDYMIMEAVSMKVMKEDQKSKKDAEKRDWKKDKAGLDALRDIKLHN